jgi:hypothetical protein
MRGFRSSGSRTGIASGARNLVIAVCLAALTGCYRTTELATPVPTPGTRIVAELTPSGAERMEQMIGPEAVGVEAHVAETRPDEWELSLLRVDHRRMPSVRWNGEPVVFPVETLRGVREREFDALRTAGLTVAVTAVLAVLARNFMWSQISGEPPRGPDPVD